MVPYISASVHASGAAEALRLVQHGEDLITLYFGGVNSICMDAATWRLVVHMLRDALNDDMPLAELERVPF